MLSKDIDLLRPYRAFAGEHHCTKCAGAGYRRGIVDDLVRAVVCDACQGSGRDLAHWEQIDGEWRRKKIGRLHLSAPAEDRGP